MTTRTANILLLFLGALLIAALALPLALWLGVRVDRPAGAWLAPVVIFASFVAVFFFGRAAILPEALTSPGRALTALSLWMGTTMCVAAILIWLTRPLMAALGVEHGTLAVFLACVIASLGILDRASRARRGGSL